MSTSRQVAEDGKAIKGVHSRWHASYGRVDRDGDRLLREVPQDTRDLTSRLMGDPLPGRRAIDRRQA